MFISALILLLQSLILSQTVVVYSLETPRSFTSLYLLNLFHRVLEPLILIGGLRRGFLAFARPLIVCLLT